MGNSRFLETMVVASISCIAATGCSHMNNTEAGALLGSGLGAATGAIIGHQTGHKGTGALIGAAAGGIGGALIGNAEDAREERDGAIAQAAYTEQARRADQLALTNRDVIDMAGSGVSDQIIINSIQNRGGRFDTDPQTIIALDQCGVSDEVIQVMQRCKGPTVVAAPPTVYVERPVETVIVTPAPRRHVIVAPHPRRRRVIYRHHRHW